MVTSVVGLSAIDLFAGCGGLTTGLRRARFNVIASVENDAKAAETYSLNHPKVRLFQSDIQKINAHVLREDLELTRGALRLMAGCPPCQGFSRMRTKNGVVTKSDPRNALIEDFGRFVEEFLPWTVMLENVPALEHDGRFIALREALGGLGYCDVVQELDAADYGVPQRRRRLIYLASRVHRPEIAPRFERRLTVRQAIARLPSTKDSTDPLHCMLESRSQRVMEVIRNIPKDGGSRTELPYHLQLACHSDTKGFYDVYGRMRWDDVAPTITTGCSNPSKGRFTHPVEDRNITLREAAILQGFPRSYRFNPLHGKEAIARMIGNALPPRFIAMHAFGLARAIQDAVAVMACDG